MLKSGPPVDVVDLQFKLQCRLKVFENKDISQFPNPNSLVTCASRYGLLFVGTNSQNFQVIQSRTVQNYTPKEKDVSDYPRREIQIASSPKHLSVNCDSTILAVVVENSQCPTVIFYDVLSFLQQNIKVIQEIRLSPTPNVYIQEINWNPSLPAIFTACKSDGSLGVYELKGESVELNELPTAALATCFCWSPKGKQIAVGSIDGKITQYKPDLKAVKVIAEPKLEGGCSLIGLQWVSNYQFIGSYHRAQDSSSFVIVVDAPKSGETTFTNYEDICYSGSSRLAQFYMILQHNWNFLMVASANSTEIGVLSNTGEAWTQWLMLGSARAELPLSSDHEETLPIGMTFDVSSTTPLLWEESTIPPCPLLCILSHQGVLHCFNVVYLKQGIPSVCTPPDNVNDTSGLSYFVAKKTIQQPTSDTKFGISNPPQQQVASNETKFGMAPNPQQMGTNEIKFGQLQPAATPTKNVVFNFPVSSQSTPLALTKTTTSVVTKTLFAGQTTLTPIKPQKPNENPSLFTAQSLITPANKAPEKQQSTNFPEKYSSIFSALNPTSAPQISTAPVKPIVISATPIHAATPRTTLAETPRATKEDPTVKQENQAETNAMITQMVKDEWMYLEAEIRILLKMGGSLKLNIGNDAEKVDMVEQLKYLDEFVKEAVDISVGQSNEIHCLKQNLLQSWAWYEEARSHYNASKNKAVALLIKCQPLDTLSEKRLRDIRQLVYYIESQISQVNKTLDEEWDNFQDYARKTYTLKMPTMETIFQTMVKQSAVLQRQTYLLERISKRLAKTNSLSLDKMGNLTDVFENLTLNPQQIRELQYDKIRSYSKNLSQTKTKELKNLLNKREITKVTAVKPQISSFAINQSPTSRMRQSISMLGANVSPAAKASIAKSLSFAQSPSPKTTSEISTKTIEKTTPSFGTLLKTGPVISSSQGSAFTPIGASSTSDNQKITTPSFSFAAVSTASSKHQAPSSTFSSIFKPTSEPSTPAWTTFSFGSTSTNTSTPKNVFGSTSASGFSTPASSTSVLFSSKPSFSISTPLATKTTTSQGNLEVSKAPTKPPSGVASIFANIQSVIDKSTNAATTISSTSVKLASSASVAATTTTQSLFGTFSTSTTAPTKPLFGSFTTSDSGNLFGSVSKPTASNVENATTFSFKAASSSSDKPKSTDKESTVGEIKTSAEATVIKSEPASIPSKIITVSLFDSKPNSSASDQTNTESVSQSLFTGNIGPMFGQTNNKPLFGNLPATSEAPSIFGDKKTATAQPQIFGSTSQSSTLFSSSPAAATTTAANIFVSAKNSQSSTGSVFASNASSTTSETSVFGSAAPTSVFGSTATTKTTAATTTSLFGTPTAIATSTIEAPSASSTSVFGASSATALGAPSATAFGSSAATSTFGAATSTPLFGTPTTTSTFETPALFGAPTTSTFIGTPDATSTSVFGTPTASTAPSAFGAPTTSTFGTPDAASVFGTPTASTAPSAFGAPTSSIFGAATNTFGTPSTSGNIFGTPSTTSNIFGSASSTAVFGAAPPANTGNIFASQPISSASAFGSPASTPNVFGSTAPTTSASIFGSATAAPFGSQTGSMFGAPTTTSGSVFGQPAAFGSQSVFGGTPAASGSSVFGQAAAAPAAPAASGNIFASSASTNVFGSGFGAAPATTNVFGSPAETNSSNNFGFGGLNVGSQPSGSVFGGTASGAATFGQSPTANPFAKVETTQSAFGSSSSSIFGGAGAAASTNIFGSPAATTASSIFGSSTGGGFGSPSAFGSSTFGQQSTFGSSTFGSPQPAPGPFSGGAATSPTAQGAFGAPPSYPGSSGFGGGGSVFGGSTFGTSTFGTSSFGNASAFGAPTAFGGSAAPGGGFADAAGQESTTFGNLANQNTIGFGTLAQQANAPTSMPFSGGASFSSWR